MLSEPITRALPEVIRIRRDLHAHPELSFQEHRTSKLIRETLARLTAVEVLPPLMETDVIAVLNRDGPGRCLALRADIDALPVTEQSELPHRSTVAGVMHACGHDGHTAVLLGAAIVLSQVADELPGQVKFIFQPAEEDRGGARVLCERGVLENPHVDAAFALHAWPNQPVGSVAVRHGPVTAANNEFEITVRGRSGHGAYPQRCIDPIVTAAHVVTALQTIVSRTVPPLDSAVVTIGEIAGGSATNVIPAECRMRGTIRYYRPELGEQIRQRVRDIAEHVARAHGAEADVQIRLGYPPLLNDPALADLIERTGGELLGPERVITTEDPSMGAEDFAFYAQHVPAAMFRLGLRPPGVDTYPGLHTPTFDFNDDAAGTGILMLCELARRFLSQRK